MNTLESELLAAAREDRLLDYIDEQWRAERDDRDPLSEELARLHNEGKIDVVAAFRELRNDKRSPDFFATEMTFEKILPRIEAPISDVMECVLHLFREAGQDLAIGSIIGSYTDFCAAEPSRPREAVGLIEASEGKLAGLLTPSLVAGSRLDAEYYLNEAIRLSAHPDMGIREKAILSLGRIEYPQNSNLPEKALMTLEHAIGEEDDDPLIANIIWSAFDLYKKRESLETRVTGLIDTALSKGADLTLYAASRILWFENKKIPEPLLDRLLSNLRRVNPSKKGVLQNIGYGLRKLLAGKDSEKAIRFIEDLLIANPESLSLDEFDGVTGELLRDKEGLLNRVMTRWFLRGERVLCEAIHHIVSHRGLSNDLALAVHSNELHSTDAKHILFLARKVIGYLFFRPVTAAGIVLSLVQHAEDDETKKALLELLFDPLLINYPGKVGDYLKEHADSGNESVKAACKKAMAGFEQYGKELESANDIPELHPYQSQREAYGRHHFRQMSEVTRQGKEKSMLGDLFSESVLLYGRGSIVYVYAGDKTNRKEIPFQRHRFSTEIPRLSVLAPFDLDYTLRAFQAEEMTA
ncbi:MAG: hypothetical protein BECKG1743D_GA0114223_100415 [Candidatus Kentron sp. G]|nr:MAG: hypothetical protein BECKG1743F_GA0114225_100414 [Candidatus Kentron sp. G]VFM96119.1 MAG: hypothetical protein BECKG1743E_GA0114224_100374 [Candidatus Kentron sp. G]VFM98006.1 MAG: hypothetical protein BECKG1743D_GA0114223_100415 [Candidatus Kentron sp. G]